jgi:hypothetical protein
MLTHLTRLRADLERRAIDHLRLTDTEVFHLGSAIRGWHVMPRTARNTGPISARVWLASALAAGGRYRAPDAAGHPAELGDGGLLVDAVVLMAVVQRHFLPAPGPAWDDASLGEQLGLDRRDITRAQAVLDAVQDLVPRGRPPLGTHWWDPVRRPGR